MFVFMELENCPSAMTEEAKVVCIIGALEKHFFESITKRHKKAVMLPLCRLQGVRRYSFYSCFTSGTRWRRVVSVSPRPRFSPRKDPRYTG
jgi:hypothetical protein